MLLYLTSTSLGLIVFFLFLFLNSAVNLNMVSKSALFLVAKKTKVYVTKVDTSATFVQFKFESLDNISFFSFTRLV